MRKVLALFILALAAASFGETAEAAEAVMRLFTERDYVGQEGVAFAVDTDTKVWLGEIAYSTEMMNNKRGIPEKTLSSFWLSDGYEVTFYEEINLQGASISFKGGAYTYIGDEWNDRVSSYDLRWGGSK